MIDWDKTSKMSRMSVDDLKARFVRFPKSEKLVYWVCAGGCGNEGERVFNQSHRLCSSCAKLKRFEDPKEIVKLSKGQLKRYEDPKEHEKTSLANIKRYEDPKEHEKTSESSLKAHRDDPTIAKRISESGLRRWDNPHFLKRMSEARLNSDAAKVESERQRGGNDIVMHHWLYDDADLSKYTMPMTRKEHSTMHARMQLDGYKVSHINSETDDNGLWGYRCQ